MKPLRRISQIAEIGDPGHLDVAHDAAFHYEDWFGDYVRQAVTQSTLYCLYWNGA